MTAGLRRHEILEFKFFFGLLYDRFSVVCEYLTHRCPFSSSPADSPK